MKGKKITKKERKHVKIQSPSPGGDGRFTVTWYTGPGERHRFTTTQEAEAEKKADEKEEELENKRLALAKCDDERLRKINEMLCMIPADVDPIQLAVCWLKHGDGSGKPRPFKDVSAEYQPLVKDTGKRNRDSLRLNLDRFCRTFVPATEEGEIPSGRTFGETPISEIIAKQISAYLNALSDSPKTRLNHFVSLKSVFNMARLRRYLPFNEPTAMDGIPRPDVSKTRRQHVIYTPEQMIRILAAAPIKMLPFFTFGGFGGLRRAERSRTYWCHYEEEHSQLALDEKVTKTGEPRNVPVEPNFKEWIDLCRGENTEPIVPAKIDVPYWTQQTHKNADVDALENALRAGFVSYYRQKHQNSEATALAAGHSVYVQRQYNRLTNKKEAEAWFSITPESVLEFVKKEKLPLPEWAALVKAKAAEQAESTEAAPAKAA